MLKKLLFSAALAGLSTPALAQNGPTVPPPSPYAPQPDKPTCTMDELKAATTAYVEAKKSGQIAKLPLDPKAHFLQDMQTVEKSAGLWDTALALSKSTCFHVLLCCFFFCVF